MKKALVILAAIAILGALAGYALTRDKPDTTAVEGSSQTGAQNQSKDRSVAANHYPDGTYTGEVAETLYGNVQIGIVVSSGRISDVQYLQMPDKDDGRSRQLTERAEPLLKATTLDKQSDQIDFVTGATSTSFGYQQSLQSALDKAAEASNS
jgi:uncharacterized protein with FMN-binding domain